ncbi:MAG TPA: hypothetical protein ENG11_03615 [candidate division Zixibacteria bacterium]|nr:hypothetical protein [candidate division Zixibacteria bacterium]
MYRKLLAGLILLSFLPIYGYIYPGVVPMEKFNYLYFAESGVVPKHLHPKVGIYYWNFSGSEYFNNNGHREDYNQKYSESWVVPMFAFGTGDAVEFGVCFPVLSEKYEDNSGFFKYTADASGLGDITLWTKAIVTRDPNFGLRVAAKLATGDDAPGEDKLPTGTGQTDIDMGFVLSHYPEKMGFACDVAVGFRLRMSKEVDTLTVFKVGDRWYMYNSGTYDPGDEGRLQLYLGGMPMEGFGILFGGDGFVSLNDRWEGDEIRKSYRASAAIGMKAFFETKFGLRLDGGFKFDVAGKDYPAGFGLMLGATFVPQY